MQFACHATKLQKPCTKDYKVGGGGLTKKIKSTDSKVLENIK